MNQTLWLKPCKRNGKDKINSELEHKEKLIKEVDKIIQDLNKQDSPKQRELGQSKKGYILRWLKLA